MNKSIKKTLENQALIMLALSRLMMCGNILEIDVAKKLQDKYAETIKFLQEN